MKKKKFAPPDPAMHPTKNLQALICVQGPGFEKVKIGVDTATLRLRREFGTNKSLAFGNLTIGWVGWAQPQSRS